MDDPEKRALEDATHVEKTRSDSEVIHDGAILGDKQHAIEDAMHFGHLSEEELILQKKLLRRIDFVIMPMVVLVRKPVAKGREA